MSVRACAFAFDWILQVREGDGVGQQKKKGKKPKVSSDRQKYLYKEPKKNAPDIQKIVQTPIEKETRMRKGGKEKEKKKYTRNFISYKKKTVTRTSNTKKHKGKEKEKRLIQKKQEWAKKKMSTGKKN